MEALLYVLVASVATILTRFLPFFIFKKSSKSQVLAHLQENSGLFIMLVLVIYVLKSLNASGINLVFAICCTIFVLILQAWRGNFMLSIVGATSLYMAFLHFA